MPKSVRNLRVLSRCTRAATAIEYAPVAAIISLAALVSIQFLGSSVNNSFTATSQAFQGS